MQRIAWRVLACAAFVVSCNREPSPKDLCDHLGSLEGAPRTQVQVENCVTEMANAKSTSKKEYACFAPCAAKATSEADVDTCKFTCAGDKDTPATVCHRLMILRGGRGAEGSCVARYTTMQTTASAQFDCAASCVRKASARADAENCLSGCPTGHP